MSDRAGGGLLFRLTERDTSILHALLGWRSDRLNRAMRLITRFGDPASVIGFSLGLILAGSPRVRQTGFVAAFALAFSHLLVQILKRSISRPRPRLPVGVASLINAPDRFSFPSGHAAAALSVTLAVMPLMGFPAGTLLVGGGMLVGISRCYLGVHYPGDVIAGWLLAVVGVFSSALL
jgi:undecaprenyl-diphosphatase